jgi:two-component system cell cycle sensor histidine kinase/response regulator CckA
MSKDELPGSHLLADRETFSASPDADLFSDVTIAFESPPEPTETIDLRSLVGELYSRDVREDSRIESTPFGDLLHALPVPVLVLDRPLRIIFANRSWRTIIPDHEKLEGRPFSSLFPTDSVATQVQSLAEKVFEAKRAQVSGVVLEMEKKRMWSRMHLRSINVGRETSLLVIVEDITAERKRLHKTQRQRSQLLKTRDELEESVRERTAELNALNEQLLEEIENRKEAEKGLEASRASFTSIVEKTGEGIAVLDPEGMILYANPALGALLGKSDEQMLGARVKTRLVAGELIEITGSDTDGQPKVLEMRVEQSDWNGKPAFVALFRNITERKRAEQELLKAQKLESLELIAGGIAHDFNNLLTGTLTNISRAKMRATRGTDLYEALRIAEQSAASAKHLTQQLLTFTEHEAEPAKTLTALSELLEQTTALSLSGSNVKVELSIPPDLWSAEVDARQISQVIQNLLINAQQAMPNGGRVHVSAENWVAQGDLDENSFQGGQRRYVKIAIKDEGPGIPQDNLSRIFDPHFTTKPKGSGLGLATALSIVKKHGGQIEVESMPNAGTTFFVYVPASEKDAEISVEESAVMPAFRTGRILLMDDEDVIREATGDLLRLLGYEVECARDGSEAIELYSRALESGEPFCAVIIDLTVAGGMGGKEAMERLLEIDPEVKAIVSSGYVTDPIMADHKRYGFAGIVAKPYNARDLSRVLNDVLSDG